MSKIDLVIPDDLRDFLATATSKGGFTSETDYLCDLIRNAWLVRTERQLEQLLLEGLEGPFVELDEVEWEAMQAEAISGWKWNGSAREQPAPDRCPQSSHGCHSTLRI